ncbi:hypothetical protein [Arcanobacterium phocae]|uniref:hypothetical protein n=1 Tax=Arcanobacterium phocae TaxID=131112 RepID=UPI001C0F39FA|nr:hypothetical protein [Arcanobacterium phocae]
MIARVNDAGVIKSPIETIFAVMELEEESVTLEYWLKERKKYLNSSECHEFTPNAYDDACTLANSLDVAVGLLISIGVLHQHEIIHGDLHPGNILISGESVNTNNPADLRSILAPGNLEPVRARIIDLGTSEAEGTSREIGEVREVNAIITDVGNILKPITRFLNVKLSDLLKICREDSSYQGLSVWKFGDSPVLPQELAGDLLRLIGVLNLVLGYADNREDTADPLALDGHELKDFNTFMNESNGDHIKAISANVLQSLSENRVSRGRLVNWPSVWEKICERWKCFSNFEVVSYQYAGVDFYLRSRARSEDRN